MADIIKEAGREIPVIKRAHVLVVGGGTAGVPAAIAAARRGKKTVLVEQLAFLGGTATAGLVTPLMHNNIKGNPSPSGINSEIIARLLDCNAAAVDSSGNDGWFDPVYLAFVLEQMALEAGVDILFNSFFCSAICDGGVIKGIVVENKGGRGAILAERVIDATGDADVAFRCGAPFASGRPGNGINQPTSLRFEMGGIDFDKFCRFLESLGQKGEMSPPFFHTAMVWGRKWALEPIFRQAVEAGDLEERDGNYFQAFGIPGKPGCVSFNCPEIEPEADVTRPDYQSHALVDGRRAILRLVCFMKKYFAGFENAWLMHGAAMLGVRESRRIVGEYVLTSRDILTYTKFEDAIARSNYPVDVHGAQVECGEFEIPIVPEGERYFEIPYRCLVPKGVENLLVAGRSFSSDYVGQSSPRVQPSCRAFGEVAGIAAALSMEMGINPRALDGRKVRAIMKEAGAYL